MSRESRPNARERLLPFLPALRERQARDHTDARYTAGMACLEAYNVEGTPFAVQLRTFERPTVYGAKRDGSGGVLLEDDLYRWSQQRGTNFIRVHDVAGVPGVGPAIVIDGPGWQEAAEAVIGAAELVVSECQYFTRGVSPSSRRASPRVEPIAACCSFRPEPWALP